MEKRYRQRSIDNNRSKEAWASNTCVYEDNDVLVVEEKEVVEEEELEEEDEDVEIETGW